MMYSPLQPDASSQVEIAQSEICIDEEGDVISERLGEGSNEPELAQGDKGKEKVKKKVSVGNDGAKNDGAEGQSKKRKEVRVGPRRISTKVTF